jgi:hypothetical protein
MLRKIVKLGVVLLIIHALYRSIPVYIRYYEFRDAVREVALFSKGRTDSEVAQRIMQLAAKYEIPLEQETIQIRHEAQTTFIDAEYTENIEWLPSYKRSQPFTISVDAMSVRPTTVDDVIK